MTRKSLTTNYVQSHQSDQGIDVNRIRWTKFGQHLVHEIIRLQMENIRKLFEDLEMESGSDCLSMQMPFSSLNEETLLNSLKST